MRRLARIPIRLRLTLAFGLAMAVVLAGTGVFLYLRLGDALLDSVDRGLRGRADGVVAVVRQGDIALPQTPGTEPAQVLDARGHALESTVELDGRPLADPRELAGARTRAVFIERATGPGSDDPFRLLVTPVDLDGRRLFVVVGTSLEAREDALEGLLAQLLIGGPVALLLASLLGYRLAGAALRPVERMRREAEAVSASEPGRRLPLPAARDEITRLGETLNGMLARLEAALARERRFVSDASHELRTPLASLRAELELALRRPRSREELEAALRSAGEESERLSQLAEDLLVLARSDAGRLPIRRERLPAAELLAGVQARYARRAAEVGRPLETKADDGLELSLDRMRAEQALGNLVENALRHGRGRILLHAHQNDSRVELHVRDEGQGFSPGFIDRAFEPFSRQDEARSSPGAGLGLAIVAVIARAHGGAAYAANLDGGADIWIELPADATDVVGAGHAPPLQNV